MKQKLSLLFGIIILLSTMSCMRDYPNSSDASKEIKISASIDGSSYNGVKTRASNSSWDAGDAIGVFMKKSTNCLSSALKLNVKYITVDGTSTFSPFQSNGINFPFQNEKIDFIAYYPFKEELTDLNYSIDVSNQSNLAEIDLLYADNVKGIDNSTENVNLSFKHQLSKIVLNITMEEGGPDLNGLKAEITDVNTKASFSLVDSSISKENTPRNISFNVSENGTLAEVILLPTKSLTDKKLLFTLGENSYSYNLSNATIKSFEKSTKYTLNVRLKPGVGVALEVVSNSIVDWESESIAEDIDIDEDTIDADIEEGSEDGDGTLGNPYTVEQVEDKVGEKSKWVKGFIVGSYGSTFRRHRFIPGIVDAGLNNIAIATSSTETDLTKTFVIDITGVIGNSINLRDNKDNLREKILLCGDILYPNDNIELKNVKKAILIDK